MKKLVSVINAAIKNAASDAHLRGDSPVELRVGGTLYSQNDIRFSFKEIDELAASLLTDGQKDHLRHRKALDFSAFIVGTHVRVNIVSTSRGLVFSLRFLPGRVPSVEELNLHPIIGELSEQKEGLILVCGPTGSGKTSTIASMINAVNSSRSAHIVTLEDPIEYRYTSQLSIVDQREMRMHFNSFEQALEDVLRQSPDVIMVGELKAKAVISHTINIAESGHLVIGTMHAHNVETAIYRLLNAFPPESHDSICSQLSSVLKAVVIQKLDYLPGVDFRVPHLSILRTSQAVRNIIREKKVNQIENALDVGTEDGMFTFDRYKSDFLDTKEHFYPPGMLYKHQGKTEDTQFVYSSMVDYYVPMSMPSGTSPAMGVAPAVSAPQPPAQPARRASAPKPQQSLEVSGTGPGVVSLDAHTDYKELVQQLKTDKDDEYPSVYEEPARSRAGKENDRNCLDKRY